MREFIVAGLLLLIAACGSAGTGSGSTTTTTANNPTLTGASFVTYSFNDQVYRIIPESGELPQNVSLTLDGVSAGADSWLNISKNGQYYLLETTRFGCADWACLAVVNSGLTSGAAVMFADASTAHPRGFSAVDNEGNGVVYPSETSTGRVDLYYTTTTDGTTWSTPINITEDSTFAYNYQPAFNNAANLVVFNCGTEAYASAGTSICQVSTSGTSFEVVARPTDNSGTASNALNHPSYNVDGTVTFESDWSAEQVWKRSAAGAYTAVNSTYTNDNSPCVLTADDRIVSLYLSREGGTGAHEIKVMDTDGTNFFMLLQDIDVDDIGIGCSE